MAGSAQVQINRSDILIDYPVNERPTRGGCGYRGALTNLVMADILTPRSTAPRHPQTVPDGSLLTANVSTLSCPQAVFLPATEEKANAATVATVVSLYRHNVAIRAEAATFRLSGCRGQFNSQCTVRDCAAPH